MNARLLTLPLALCLSAAASVSRADTSSGAVKDTLDQLAVEIQAELDAAK